MRCSFCGYEFDPKDQTCRPACPMHQSCHMVCCPNCGYVLPDPSRARMAGWLQRFLDKREASKKVSMPKNKGISLLNWDVGRPGKVVDVAAREPGQLARLSSMGLVPGSVVTVRQRRPAYIVQVDATEWALDPSIAAQIFVDEVKTADHLDESS